MKGRALLPLALGALLGTACLQAGWRRTSRYEPIPEGALAGLEARRTDLGDCLRTFGAPLWVWEHDEAGRAGAVLAYGWFDERDFGLQLSLPLSDYASASFDYATLDQRMHGLVLFFDGDWKLTHWRTGLLRDLTREAARPPAALEEDA